MTLATILIVLFVVVVVGAIVSLVLRMRRNEPLDSGGSFGDQMTDSKDD